MPISISRRTFLKASAAASAMLLAPVAVIAQPEMPRTFVRHEWDRLKTAVVGIPRIRFPEQIPENMIRGASSNWITFLYKARGKELEEAHPEMAARLISQVDQVVGHLRAKGVRVLRPEPLDGKEMAYRSDALPPCCCQLFPRDPYVVVRDQLIETNMAQGYRWRERFGIWRCLEQWDRGLARRIKPMTRKTNGKAPILEGGDVIALGKEILVGISGQASNIEGARWLQEVVGDKFEVHPVKLDPRFQHLDCALSLPAPGKSIICPEAFPDGIPPTLKAWHLVSVSIGEALAQMACNPLILDDKSLIMPSGMPALAEAIGKQGIDVIETPLDMPVLFRGGLRCMHLALERG